MGVNYPEERGRRRIDWHMFRLKTPKGVRFRETSPPFHWKTTLLYRTDVEDWCLNHVKGPWAEKRLSGSDYHLFMFQDKADAMLFKLTWCDEIQKPKFTKVG